MPRLQNPRHDTIPENVSAFLAKFPPDEMFQMLAHSPATVQPFIGLAQTLYTSLQLPLAWRKLTNDGGVMADPPSS